MSGSIPAPISGPNTRSSTPLPRPSGPTNDHSISFRPRLSQREYPPDCPPLSVRWYYAVDAPKRKPFQTYSSAPQKPSKPPAKFVPFGPRDSRAIEAAFQKLSQEEEELESLKYETASAIDRFKDADIGDMGSSWNPTVTAPEQDVMVPVNEDYLFEVDIKKRELAPVYWEGPVYDVRRGTWFYQEGSTLRPCDENLATQIEDGYLSLKPFRIYQQDSKGIKGASLEYLPTRKDSDGSRPSTAKDGVSSPQTQPTWRLFGAYLNSFVVFVDPNTAWLFTDDFYGKLTATVWQKMSAGTHMGGIKIVRNYSEPRSGERKDSSRPATPPVGERPVADHKQKGRLTPVPPTSNQTDGEPIESTSRETARIALERKISTYSDDREAQEKMMESEMNNDYRDDEETDEPDRQIEHLLLVTHGIGQKLSMRMESVNFVHDVNVFRKSLKGVYGVSPDLQVLNGELGEGTRKNCRVQCLPVCWRHLLDFPKQSLRKNFRKQDPSAKFEEYPSLEDITVEGAPYVRNLMTDLALDVLLYQSGTYREHIIHAVLTECNRIYALFKKHNPDFKGKVSLVGHSLGSAIIFDILCRQPDDRPWVKKPNNELPPLDFAVESFFSLGSPVGLFQMLKGRTISARSISLAPASSPMDTEYSTHPFTTGPQTPTPDTGPFPVSAPKCGQLFNIFHPADPISYRIEPLVSKAMAQLKPQPLPYTKRGLFSSNGQIVGGISGIGQSVTRSVSNMWASLSTGIASSILNRSLGFTDTSVSTATSAATAASIPSEDKKSRILHAEGRHPPTMIDAEIETLYDGFQKQRKYAVVSQTEEGAEKEENSKYEQDEGRVKNEEEKVRALNSTGRIDFAIQEGVFDISVIASIASHLSYWGDEDVSHFVISQLLSRSRVLKRTSRIGGAGGSGKDLGDGWTIDDLK